MFGNNYLAAYYVTAECYSSWVVRNHMLRDIIS